MLNKLTRNLGIAPRLFLMNLLVMTLFVAMGALTYQSFLEVEQLVDSSVSADIEQNRINASLLQELSVVFSQTGRLLGGFVKNEKELESQGTRLVAAVEKLASGSENDKRLINHLQDHADRLRRLFKLCADINLTIRKIEQLEQRQHKELNSLEQVVSDARISMVINGQDPVTMDQLVVMVAGYNDSLKSLNLLFFRSISDQSPHNISLQHKQMLAMIDDYLLRLKSLTASEPNVSRYSGVLGSLMQSYRSSVINYYNLVGELGRQSNGLVKAEVELNSIMRQLENDIAASSGNISKRVHEIIASSRLRNLLIVLASAFISSITIVLFVASVIRKPMDTVIRSIDLIAGGNLDTRISLNRNDEWSLIESALNRMSDDLGHSYTKLEQSNRDLQAEIILHEQTEESLRRASQYTENLIQCASIMIVGHDMDGALNLFNRTAETITGYAFDEVKGKPLFDVLSVKVLAVESGLPTETSATALTIGSYEKQIVCKNGQIRIISWRNSQILEDGVMVGTISFGIDITEHRKIEEQLQQSQKMEAIGRLAGGVAHDFNNMLGVILGYAEISMLLLDKGNKIRPNLKEIIRAADRSRDITRQLLAFSRRDVISPRPLELNGLISETQKALSRLIGEDIQLIFQPFADLWAINADPAQMDQILINLVVNARDAMPDGGRIFIETSNISIDQSYCEYQLDASPGRYVRLSVCDTGIGMDAETQKHIFEPFFTTKAMGKGTGLGLATIFGIVSQNKGFIKVYSEPGYGTTFNIFLPAIDEAPQTAEYSASLPVLCSGVILLVEDEPSVLQMTAMMLEGFGYQVIATCDPFEAIGLCRDDARDIDMVISDIIMPNMNGREMIRQIRESRPQMRVLLMSGYTSDMIVRQGIVEGDMHFIQKPFDMAGLYKKVRETMS